MPFAVGILEINVQMSSVIVLNGFDKLADRFGVLLFCLLTIIVQLRFKPAFEAGKVVLLAASCKSRVEHAVEPRVGVDPAFLARLGVLLHAAPRFS